MPQVPSGSPQARWANNDLAARHLTCHARCLVLYNHMCVQVHAKVRAIAISQVWAFTRNKQYTVMGCQLQTLNVSF